MMAMFVVTSIIISLISSNVPTVYGGTSTKVICEYDSGIVSCGNSQRLDIQSANYGRLDSTTCNEGDSRPVYSTSCGASDSLQRVKEKCQDKSSCTLTATNDISWYGDPCASTFKYLEIKYSCISACDVVYGGKCFVFHRHDKQDIKWSTAQEICSDAGSQMANIYSESHHNALMNHLRTLIPSGKTTIFFWLGMRYDPNTKKLFLSDGREAPYVKWSSGHPTGTEKRVGLQAKLNSASTSQNVYVAGKGASNYGVICEA